MYTSILGRAIRIVCLHINFVLTNFRPNHLPTYCTLAEALVEKGRYQEAEGVLKKRNLMTPAFQIWLDVRMGDLKDARQLLKDNPSIVNPHTAVARYLLGDQEAGLAELG